MDDTTVMIKVDFQDMQIIGMMHSVIVKNRAKCGVQEIRCQRLIVDIGQKFVYTKLIVLKEVLRESSFGELIGGSSFPAVPGKNYLNHCHKCGS